MSTWVGLALALRRPAQDGMRSRVPTYIHPLAGRALAWHGLHALATLEPPPHRLLLASASPLDPSVVRDVPAEIIEAPPPDWWSAIAGRLGDAVDRVLVVDAAAATLGPTLQALLAEAGDRGVLGETGPLAAWIDRPTAATLAREDDALGAMVAAAEARPPATAEEDCLVRDRRSLARAGAIIRDRLVANLMEHGATFLLPDTVHVDVDVRVGPDTVIYPGVVLEGTTTVGAETVIGPGCRIIDSRVGSGVELKGWNYIVDANIRNRAVLEPYVRRGFD